MIDINRQVRPASGANAPLQPLQWSASAPHRKCGQVRCRLLLNHATRRARRLSDGRLSWTIGPRRKDRGRTRGCAGLSGFWIRSSRNWERMTWMGVSACTTSV
jgi:hypothetical protein